MTKDYINTKIEVAIYPKISVTVDKATGESLPTLDTAIKRTSKVLTIIIDPDGHAVYPENLYLHNLLVLGAQNTTTSAQALLSFTRFLTHIGKDYTSLTDDPHEGAAWLYGYWLIDNIVSDDDDEDAVQHKYSLSTARSYMSIVINFYKWLHSQGVQAITQDAKPFEFKWVKIPRKKQSEHDMLAHIKKNRSISVQTTTLMAAFPKSMSQKPWQRLKPMADEDKELFMDCLSKEKTSAGEVKSLMLRFSLATGVRVQELVTIPESKINNNYEDDNIKFSIGPSNKCETKFKKEREIEIPYDLMLELDEYKQSVLRQKLIKGTAHGRLFVTNQGTPFSKNTIQSFFGKLRKKIKAKNPDWYYKMHDLRATFATYWMKDNSASRSQPYAFLLSDLAELMGHQDTNTTQKYVIFMEKKNAKIRHSAFKNKQASKA